MSARFATYISFHSSTSALARAGRLLAVIPFPVFHSFEKVTEAISHCTAKPRLVVAEGRLVTHTFTKSIMQFCHSLTKNVGHPVLRRITYRRVSILVQGDDNVHVLRHVRVTFDSSIPSSAYPNIYMNGFVRGLLSLAPWSNGNWELSSVIIVLPVPMNAVEYPIIVVSMYFR